MTLKLLGSSSGHTALDAPASAGSNTITLPANNGTAGQVLQNSSTAGTLQFGPPGKVIQSAYSTTTTEIQKTYSDGWSAWTGLARTFTPLSSTSHLMCYLFAIRGMVVGGSGELKIKLNDGSADSMVYRMTNYDTSNNSAFNPTWTWYWPLTHTAGAQITVTPQIYSTGTNVGQSAMLGDNGSTSYFLVTEIQV